MSNKIYNDMKLIIDKNEIDISYLWSYLYPYFLRFLVKNDILVDFNIEKKIYIPSPKKEELIFILEKIFEELMEDCYKEPSQRQRTKHSSRFENILFKEKKYILNYTTDIIGIIGYRLFYLINKIKKQK